MKIIKLFKRWFDMLTGKSIFHVKQGVGNFYSKDEVKGYYNDLTGKVNQKTKLDDNGIPLTTTIIGINAYFPIAIFQYGLGLYDLFLEKNDIEILKKFIKIADWAIDNINESGMWDCMGTLKDSKHFTQSSMCQSEGVSVLLRAYIQTKKEIYLLMAKKAIRFMITDIKDGGTCLYLNDEIIFQEYVNEETALSVLNGWIFSIFGLYDYVIFSGDKEFKGILEKTIQSLVNNLQKYDRNFWSNYDQKGTIASPSYHDVHIMQLEILFDLFEKKEFKEYANKWKEYQSNTIFKILSMILKLKQKIFKSKYYDINTSTVE